MILGRCNCIHCINSFARYRGVSKGFQIIWAEGATPPLTPAARPATWLAWELSSKGRLWLRHRWALDSPNEHFGSSCIRG